MIDGGSFTFLCFVFIFLMALADLLLFGFPETPIPYNYPFFSDILILL